MTTQKYAGNGLSKVFLPDVKGMIVLDRDVYTTLTNAKTLAGWEAHIAPATTAAIKGTYIDLARGFDLKSQAPEFTTANTGYKEKTKDFAPEFTGYGFMSFEDYRTWFASDTNEYTFVMVLANGDLLCPLDSSGRVIGFDGRVFMTFDLPKPGGEGKQKACPFDIMFDDVEQIKNYQVVHTAFGRRELEQIVPVGLNVEILTPYESSGGTVIVKATHRVSGSPYNGLTATSNWSVISTSTDDGGACTAISASSAALGIYTLTFLNGAAKMTGAFEIQGEKITSSHVTYLTNVLNVPV